MYNEKIIKAKYEIMALLAKYDFTMADARAVIHLVTRECDAQEHALISQVKFSNESTLPLMSIK